MDVWKKNVKQILTVNVFMHEKYIEQSAKAPHKNIATTEISKYFMYALYVFMEIAKEDGLPYLSWRLGGWWKTNQRRKHVKRKNAQQRTYTKRFSTVFLFNLMWWRWWQWFELALKIWQFFERRRVYESHIYLSVLHFWFLFEETMVCTANIDLQYEWTKPAQKRIMAELNHDKMWNVDNDERGKKKNCKK